MMLLKKVNTLDNNFTKENEDLFLTKRLSSIHGLGVFTERNIIEGEQFYFVPLDKTELLPKPRHAYIGNNTFVNDKLILNWVNHSCEPNSILDTSDGKPKLIAKRNIEEGEEITVDYEQTEIGGQEKIKCNCRSSNCRGFFKIIA